MEISFGHTAWHSPSFEHMPKPSASICSTMRTTRRPRSGWPWGSSVRWVILAEVKSAAEAFLHYATQAPQPMHCALSIASSTVSRAMGMALASGAAPVLTEM